MSGTVPNLENYVKNHFNVLLVGKHGTGKSQSIMQVCNTLGYVMKYYSASTLDPYTDLVGVPVPGKTDEGLDDLKMVRPRTIDDAEVIVFDELNRADPKTINAVMEIIQFHSINGEKLPKLKCIIAAINPPTGEYNVDELDPAIIDRFHVVLDVLPKVSVSYFKKIFGDGVAKALVSWWHEQNTKKRDSYVSPRRLEMMGEVWVKTQKAEALRAALPPGEVFDTSKLIEALREAMLTPEQKEALKVKEAEAQKQAAANAKVLKTKEQEALKARIANINSWTKSEYRNVKNVSAVAAALVANPTDVNLHSKIAASITNGISPTALSVTYLEIFKALNESALTSSIGKAPVTRKSLLRSAFTSILEKEQSKKKMTASDVRKEWGPIARALKGQTASTDIAETLIRKRKLK